MLQRQSRSISNGLNWNFSNLLISSDRPSLVSGRLILSHSSDLGRRTSPVDLVNLRAYTSSHTVTRSSAAKLNESMDYVQARSVESERKQMHPSYAPGDTASSDSRPAFGNFAVFRAVNELRNWRKRLQDNNESLGFVPTMGALHKGHLQLAREAANENDHVIISIYVNPTQFGVNEDLAAYPRTFESDLAKLQELNKQLESTTTKGRVTAIFAPTTKEMYPIMPPTSEIDGKGSFITMTPIGQLLEGASRPVFFRGVATVCMKLFNIVRPDIVYFGQKDVQQTVVIQRLVTDFHLDIKVKIIPTEREIDGLAMSSRNVYLGQRRRNVAPILMRALRIAQGQISNHRSSNRTSILNPALEYLDIQLHEQMVQGPSKRALFITDYISLADPDTMEELNVFDPLRGAVLSGAVKMLPVEELQVGEDQGENGGVHRPVRLIDNIVIKPDGSHS